MSEAQMDILEDTSPTFERAKAADAYGKNRKGFVCIALGVAALVAAFALVGGSVWEAYCADGAQDGVLAVLDAVALGDAAEDAVAEFKASNEDAYLSVDGVEYAGVLSVPSLSLRLPVQANYAYEALKTSPCVYSGSLSGGNLVIAGHNYAAHFGGLRGLNEGDEAIFRNVLGVVYSYEVVAVDVLGATSVDEMTQGSSAWDMTLFTCTPGGQSRVTVRLARTSVDTD